MNQAPRKFHRRIAPWLALPLLITLATGVTYRIGRAWFGMSKETGNSILHIHAGEWLGGWGSSAWILLAGGGLLALTLTGLVLAIKSRAKGQPRVAHRVLGAVLLLPLTASAVTGMTVHFGGKHLSDQAGDILMSIHQGSWLGPTLRPFYILFIGLGLLVMIATGLKLTGIFRARPAASR